MAHTWGPGCACSHSEVSSHRRPPVAGGPERSPGQDPGPGGLGGGVESWGRVGAGHPKLGSPAASWPREAFPVRDYSAGVHLSCSRSVCHLRAKTLPSTVPKRPQAPGSPPPGQVPLVLRLAQTGEFLSYRLKEKVNTKNEEDRGGARSGGRGGEEEEAERPSLEGLD